MSATRITMNAISSAGNSRMAVGETPKMATDAAESSGVRGGWSTYPNAGCCPATT